MVCFLRVIKFVYPARIAKAVKHRLAVITRVAEHATVSPGENSAANAVTVQAGAISNCRNCCMINEVVSYVRL